MSNLQILLVEDDPLHAEIALVYLRELGYASIHSTDNAAEALRLVHALQPDLLLLDIHILGQVDGVELAQKVQLKQHIPIIFITSLRDPKTIARASQAEPEAYLIKPVDQTALQAAIEISIVRLAKQNKADSITNPPNAWQSDQLAADSFFIKVGNFLRKVPLSELRHIQVSDEKYCSFHTQTSELMVRYSMSELEAKLPRNRFARIHRSYMVNLDFVVGINEKANTALLDNEEQLPIGKTYRKSVLERLNTLR